VTVGTNKAISVNDRSFHFDTLFFEWLDCWQTLRDKGSKGTSTIGCSQTVQVSGEEDGTEGLKEQETE